MMYLFKCPAGDQDFRVEAASDDEAVDKIVKEAKKHAVFAHPEMAGTPEEEMKKMIKEGIRKE